MRSLILLAIKGLRSTVGGANAPRHKAVAHYDPSRVFAGERARYASAENQFRTHCQNLMKSHLDGDLSMTSFYKTFSADLYRFQVEMYLLGRRAIKRTDHSLSEQEQRMLHGQHSLEMRYFNGFITDFVANRGKMPYAQRLDLYALGGYRLYLRGALNNTPFADRMRFPWKVNRLAEHCEDCIWKEEESQRRGGFTLEELDNEIGWPGERCKCGRRCRCHLEFPGGIKQLPRTRPTAYKAIKRQSYGRKPITDDSVRQRRTNRGIARPRGAQVRKPGAK